MKGLKTVYICSACGQTSPKWLGKCPACGAWNTLVEDVIDTSPAEKKAPKRVSVVPSDAHTDAYHDLEMPEYIRTGTGLGELDRVLGG